MSGSAGAGGGVTGSIMLVFDGHGNVGIIESGGGGGMAGVCAGGGGNFQWTNADTIYDLEGVSVQTGGSLTVGPGFGGNIGAEWVVAMGYQGFNFNIGGATGPVPIEMHSYLEEAAVQGFSIFDLIRSTTDRFNTQNFLN